ncbi:hypothetical protein [Burkholderia cepacia]|uniref:hypothetical protein n=1 Tax=Burkholderia cepacia TaxID=292 RepID=UPI002AB62BD7|nr:hypothetical protein [Burkholderia cepacia]
MFANIDRIIQVTGFVLSIFKERDTGRYSAVLTSTLHDAVCIEDMRAGPNLPAVDLQFMSSGTLGADFPVGSGKCPVEAMQALDAMLARITGGERVDVWRQFVIERIASFCKAERQRDRGRVNRCVVPVLDRRDCIIP